MFKRTLLSITVAAFAFGAAPLTIGTASAKTATQVKNENKAKAYKSTQAAKKSAKSSKK